VTKRKRLTLIYLVLAIVGLLLLAGSLSDLRFQQGLPIPAGEQLSSPSTGELNGDLATGDFMLPWILQAVLSVGILVAVTNILIAIIRNTSLKQLGLLGMILAVLILGGFILSKMELAPPANENQAVVVAVPTEPVTSEQSTLTVDPPDEWFLVVKLALATGACLVCAWLVYRIVRAVRQEDAIAREASAALKAIEQGIDFRNVIISAYLRMLQIVKEERGIEREESVTPREFEGLLAERGVAVTPIRQITRLFEQARYSTRPPDPADEQAAIDCLNAIRESCLAAGGRRK
jgi:flagellar biogenesis protein FliO